MNKSIEALKQPKVLQKIMWILNPIKYLENASKKFPDLFLSKAFVNDTVYVYSPEIIQKIFTSDYSVFEAPGNNYTLELMLGKRSIAMIDGISHKKRKKLLMPNFHNNSIKSYGKLICEVTKNMINDLPVGKVLKARIVMQEISFQIILEVVFGLDESNRSEEISQSMVRLLNLFDSPLASAFLFLPWLRQDFGSWSPWGSFIRQRDKLDKLLYEEIAARRKQDLSDRNDILSLLITARDENGSAMTNEEVRDEIFTLLFAGHETTATAMAWALYWLHTYPEVKEKLLQELDTLGKNPDPIEIAKLPYLTAVCNESLRIYPPAIITFFRIGKEPVEVLGYKLEPKTILVPCIYLIHHRKDLYPESKKFNPERFLKRKYSAYEFIPFGGGARRCIGEALAQFEMKLVLATIMSNYKLAKANNKQEKPQRRGVTVVPANGVSLVIKEKKIK